MYRDHSCNLSSATTAGKIANADLTYDHVSYLTIFEQETGRLQVFTPVEIRAT